jgi:hypothetical protein
MKRQRAIARAVQGKSSNDRVAVDVEPAQLAMQVGNDYRLPVWIVTDLAITMSGGRARACPARRRTQPVSKGPARYGCGAKRGRCGSRGRA